MQRLLTTQELKEKDLFVQNTLFSTQEVTLVDKMGMPVAEAIDINEGYVVNKILQEGYL